MPTEGTPVGRVAGKVVVITGAARGQGAAEARALAAEGAVVVATDVVAAEEVAPGELDPRTAALLYRQLNVTDPAAWARLAAELRTRFGQVHGLVNNAGCTHLARLLDVELADWERVLRVNTTGPLLGIQAALQVSRQSSPGPLPDHSATEQTTACMDPKRAPSALIKSSVTT